MGPNLQCMQDTKPAANAPNQTPDESINNKMQLFTCTNVSFTPVTLQSTV